LYTNSLPGFFSLSNHFFDVTNPTAKEMMEWRDQCDSTIRVATQILSRGTPKLGDELAEVSQAVLLGKMDPKAAADRLESGLKGWYAPHQGNKAKSADFQCDAVAPAPVSAPTTEVSAAPATSETSAVVSPAVTPAEPASAAAAPLPAPSDEVEQALSNELEAPQQPQQ
ncbi:MAG: sugar ABC transporter substrate-binding protein, partial [Aeromonas veronii]